MPSGALFSSEAVSSALASVAQNQSAYLLEVDRTRGIIYDCNLRPMVGSTRRTVAAVQPSPEAFTALTEAIRNGGETFELSEELTRPYLVQLEQTQIYSKGVEMFDAVERYSENQLAPPERRPRATGNRAGRGCR